VWADRVWQNLTFIDNLCITQHFTDKTHVRSEYGIWVWSAVQSLLDLLPVASLQKAFELGPSDCWHNRKTAACTAVQCWLHVARPYAAEMVSSRHEQDKIHGPSRKYSLLLQILIQWPSSWITHFVSVTLPPVQWTSRLVTSELPLRSATRTSTGSSAGPATASIGSYTPFNSCNTTRKLFGFLISEAVKNTELARWG
jgi:hypothetical protein